MKITELIAGNEIILPFYKDVFSVTTAAVAVDDDEVPGYYRVDGIFRGEPMTITAPGDTEYDEV
ncbi:hypothetical protein [Klebsiella quasipneumoniae]|uniref:hypothetical protein n=1 Tax=Klebsiella quasipneumoniae TaxID=1463165 RepID=UPI0021AC9A78|nr:hypothetical protein [Klebsiella quasipneumoniae]UVG20771.1 hypothetical protein NWT75_24565 [Klebsiella quasipneumoniae]